MCSLTIHLSKTNKLIVTHNRDESILRPPSSTIVKKVVIEDKDIFMPVDPLSGGTWIGTDGHTAAAILNGADKNHIRKAIYKASRGLIIPTFFKYEGVEAFLQSFDPTGYEPFTLVIADVENSMVEMVWDEYDWRVTALDPTVTHMYSSSTLYDDEVKHARKSAWLVYTQMNRSAPEIWAYHMSHGPDHYTFLNTAINDHIQTVAVSQIIIGRESEFNYQVLHQGLSKQTLILPILNTIP